MNVREAKAIAHQWVNEEAVKTPGFYGAFFHGSINDLPEDADLLPTSDVDIMVVLSTPIPAQKLGKFLYRDVLLEVSYLPREEVLVPEQVLGNYTLAGSFRTPSVILDPTGELARLQESVSQNFAKRFWVTKRCEAAQNNVLQHLGRLNEANLLHDQATACQFGAGVTTHILLVAGLKNPTVRKRYEAVRELLTEYGQGDFYETLLELLGCAQMSKEHVELHLAALAEAFDAASAVLRTPYPFAADLSASSRPVAIDGSRELIERGSHQEAVFWIAATYSRCQHVLSQDASAEMQERAAVGYRNLLADLGVADFADRQQRCEQVRQLLPRIREVSEAIMEANPKIE